MAGKGKNEIRRYVVFRRIEGESKWYLSQVTYGSRAEIDMTDECTANGCDDRDDDAGARFWRDKSNRRIVPIAVRVPAGVELQG
jgi:hypothetical protein